MVLDENLFAVRAEGGQPHSAPVPLQGDERFTALDVPDSRCALVRMETDAVVRCQDALAVRGPGGIGDPIFMAFECLQELAAAGVPDIGLPIANVATGKTHL